MEIVLIVVKYCMKWPTQTRGIYDILHGVYELLAVLDTTGGTTGRRDSTL